MQRNLRNCEWDEFRASWDHGPSVTYVYRREAGQSEFQPWIVVTRSALLARLGVMGLGLYAARPFRRDEYIGKYDGSLVAHFGSRQEAMASAQARRLLRRGHDKLVTVRSSGSAGFDLLDGEHGGPPYVQLCNDPRNTRLAANTELSDHGWLRVSHAKIPAFDLDKTLEQNAQSELRFDYGDHYWDFHESLGTHALPIECD